MAQHFITKCSCGNVIAQCRCPSKDKTVNVIERGCERCHVREVAFTQLQNGQAAIAPIVNGEIKGDFGFMVSADGLHRLYLDLHERYHGED